MIRRLGIILFEAVERHPYLLFVVTSLTLSGWSAYADDVINNDAVLYLSAASSFAYGQWGEAFAIYKWPAYSMFIGGIIAITGLNPFYAAQLVNAAFDATTVIIFIGIIRHMGAGPRGLIAAGAMIVCHLWINDMRAMIIRDHGYLTLFLLAVYFFLKDHNSARLKSKLTCVGVFLAAGLFRVEGLVIAASVVVYYGISHARTRSQKILISLALLGIAICTPFAAALWKAGLFGHFVSSLKGGQFSSIFNDLHALVFANFSKLTEILQTQILPAHSHNEARIALMGIIISIAAAGIIKSVTLVYGPMAIYAIFAKDILPDRKFLPALVWLILTNVAILFIFVSLSLFYDWRYGVALSLMIALLATFTLIAGYRYWWFAENKRKFPSIVVPVSLVTLVIALAIEGLPSPSKFGYVKEAAEWVRNNIDDQESIISNNKIMLYYADRWNRLSGPRTGYDLDPSSNYWVSNADVSSRQLKDFSFLAIELRRDDPSLDITIIESLNAEVLETFQNYRGDRIVVIGNVND